MDALQRVLVLGSNSFAGSQFVKYCLEKGHEVLGLSRSAEPAESILAYKPLKLLDKFQFIQTDINSDFEKLKNIIAEFKPEFIVDYAGQGMVAESWKTPEQWYDTNITSKVKIHNYLKDLDFLKKYIRISTPEVYGHCDDLMKETFLYNPTTPYAVSHAAIDMSLKAFFEQYNFPVVFARYANFYGPHQQLYRIIPRSIIYMRLGRKIPLHGGGHSIRAFIYADDISRGTYRALLKGVPGEIYHFSSREFIAIKDLVKLIADEMDLDFSDCVEVTEDRPGKDKAYYLNCDKAKEDLGWESEVSLREGIKRSISWVNEYFEEIKTLPLNYIHK